MASTTMTIRLPEEIKIKLGRLAEAMRRTPSFLAGEAIAAYVAREAAIVEGIEQGLDDLKAGRFVEHEAAMARISGSIDKAGTGKR
ncbi:MAG: CopG family ribbon-helix-helix protein [Aquamicrobium sp.]|nr:CopG family ribbon-helix-helix protein [Aquamicrobium sp.]